MNMETDVLPTTAGCHLLITPQFTDLVDFYWLALVLFQNTLEDIAGADGRSEYLLSLRCRLAEIAHEMDALLSGIRQTVGPGHRLAAVLARGLPHFGLNRLEVAQQLRFDRFEIDYLELQTALLTFGSAVERKLPGQIPDAQGPLGQGQMLRAIRNWSVTASKMGVDLGFLAERFRRL
jgi:hypothetical protein